MRYVPLPPPFSLDHIVPIERQRLVQNWNEKDSVIAGGGAVATTGGIENGKVLVLREWQVW